MKEENSGSRASAYGCCRQDRRPGHHRSRNWCNKGASRGCCPMEFSNRVGQELISLLFILRAGL
jgi:hypothetical protein